MAREIRGRIVTEERVIRGRVAFDEAIHAVEPDPSAPDEPLVLPGFVDLHVHGGGGADVMEGEEAVRTLARFHLRHGTTTLLPTTVCAPKEGLRRAVAAVEAVRRAPGEGEARIAGIHLEGPFLDPRALGAQPPHVLCDDLDFAHELLHLGTIRVVTLAPEGDPRGRITRLLAGHGVRVQIGHTRCTAAAAKALMEAGACGFTHLFNATSGLHHREPGAAAAALAFAEWAEIIPDLQHVDAVAILAARRAIPGLYGVTDAVAAAGMPDGTYRLGAHEVIRRGERVELPDGTLAGSVLTMDRALFNLLAIGLDVVEAARRLSTLPARRLGLHDRGAVAPGRLADLVLLDGDHRLRGVILGGRDVPLSGG